MNKADLVGVHEAGIAHHVATVCEVYSKHRSPTILHSAGAMVMKFLVVVSVNVAPRKNLFNVGQEFSTVRHHTFKLPLDLTIISLHDLFIVLYIMVLTL